MSHSSTCTEFCYRWYPITTASTVLVSKRQIILIIVLISSRACTCTRTRNQFGSFVCRTENEFHALLLLLLLSLLQRRALECTRPEFFVFPLHCIALDCIALHCTAPCHYRSAGISTTWVSVRTFPLGSVMVRVMVLVMLPRGSMVSLVLEETLGCFICRGSPVLGLAAPA